MRITAQFWLLYTAGWQPYSKRAEFLILYSFLQADIHPIFLKMYHFMFHFMSSLVTWDVVILVLIILKTQVWLHDF